MISPLSCPDRLGRPHPCRTLPPALTDPLTSPQLTDPPAATLRPTSSQFMEPPAVTLPETRPQYTEASVRNSPRTPSVTRISTTPEMVSPPERVSLWVIPSIVTRPLMILTEFPVNVRPLITIVAIIVCSVVSVSIALKIRSFWIKPGPTTKLRRESTSKSERSGYPRPSRLSPSPHPGSLASGFAGLVDGDRRDGR